MSAEKVIIFGPTGAVGSSAAATAASLGAEVVLAMRDTSKSIPSLESAPGKFSRVTADLSAPETVYEAVSSTGAKRAFVYLLFTAQDHMKATFEALKRAGIELVVFLSSFTIENKPLDSFKPEQLIPYVHAQGEKALTEVFGQEGFVALRPGSFASNMTQFKSGLAAGEVKVFVPGAMLDAIVPEDIGAVAGKVLVEGPPKDGNMTPYLFGPQLISNRDAVKTLAHVLGKKVTIAEANSDDAYKMFTEDWHMPPVAAKYIISHQLEMAEFADKPNNLLGTPVTVEDLKNIEKYSGRKATTFQEWAEKNKGLFAA